MLRSEERTVDRKQYCHISQPLVSNVIQWKPNKTASIYHRLVESYMDGGSIHVCPIRGTTGGGR